MIINDPKKAATTIVARMGNPRGEPEPEPEGDDLEMLCQEFGEAIKGGDYAGAAAAFRSMSLACASEPDDFED